VAQYGTDLLTVPAVPTKVIDRPGAGDALAGAVLDGYLNGDVQRGLEAGVALASIVLSHHGDMVFVDRKTLESTTLERRSDISR
jgi:2-dehydro-3-deoxygluconokinase